MSSSTTLRTAPLSRTAPNGRRALTALALALGALALIGCDGADDGTSEDGVAATESDARATADDSREPAPSAAPSDEDANSAPPPARDEPVELPPSDGPEDAPSDVPSDGPTAPPADEPSAPGACPAPLVTAIVDCVADLRADPERGAGNFLVDDLMACADAEPMADDRDAWCAAHPSDALCALEYETFFTDVVPQCAALAREELFAEVCLLPGEYRDLALTPGLVVVRRESIELGSEVAEDVAAQLVWASNDIGFPVETAQAAIEATDDDAFELLELFDVGSRRTLVALTAHYGDTRVGRVFFLGTTFQVAAIEDSWVTECAVERLAEGSSCDEACAEGLYCLGAIELTDPPAPPSDDEGEPVSPPGAGVCVDTTPADGADEPCASDADCDRAAGLLCAPLGSGGGEGLCRPAWLRRTFEGGGSVPVAATEIALPWVASGLATVPTRARIDLTLGQSAVGAVRLSLQNPSGTRSLVLDTSDSPTQDVYVTDLDVPVPGDESANGVWALVIESTDDTLPGGFASFTVTLDSRFD